MDCITCLRTYLRTFENSVGHHVGVLVDAAVLGVDAEQETVHAQEEKQDNRRLHSLPASVRIGHNSI